MNDDDLFADGSVLLNSATANGNLLVASSGSVATAGGGSIVAQDVQIIAGGDLATNITGSSVALATLANDTSTVTATQSLQVQAQGTLGGNYTSDGTLQLASWTGINSSTVALATNITQVWSIGPIAGSFTGTQNIGSIQSYSGIDATINSGNNQTGLPANEGNIQSVQGWGVIGGTITASNNINQVVSADAITASPTVGSGGVQGNGA